MQTFCSSKLKVPLFLLEEDFFFSREINRFSIFALLSLTPLLVAHSGFFHLLSGDVIVLKGAPTVFTLLSPHPESDGGSAKACRASGVRAGIHPGHSSQQGPVVLRHRAADA